jgi:hypothetical protein
MPSKIPDLWPDDISTDVLTPLAIMRAQVPGLERRTNGLLEVDLNSVEKEKKVVHNFDLVAPALERFRERVLTVTHERDRVYPAILQAACFSRRGLSTFAGTGLDATAMSQEEFISLMREVIRSSEVRSSIESLIARSNEIIVRDPGDSPGVETVAPATFE